LSSDEDIRRLYEFRENSRIERNSLIHSAKEQGIKQGIEQGIEQGRKEVARRLLQSGMEIALVAEMAELHIEEVKKLLQYE
jgi:predicted transposase/invertase (TIGR01784 family)